VIVTGALCWWNERPEDLDRCVRGLAVACDRVVALDGAYARYPKATTNSPKSQLAAIRDAAKEVGLGCLIIQPDRLWAGQVEKRSHLLAAASVGSDWICTVDADHVSSGNRQAARQFIESISLDVINCVYHTPANPDRSMDESAVGAWHQEQVDVPQLIPQFWRALPGLRVERFHWWYSAQKNGGRVWLWGGDGRYPGVSAENMPWPYQVEHRTMMRTPEQIRLSRAFLNDRDKIVAQTGQEDGVPGLPPPEYDYKWVPTL